MAEFCEVMKQAKRMCEAFGRTSCDGCPVSGIEKTCVLAYAPDFTNEEQMAKVECCVMDWADKHPEVRYPTWNAWLVSMGLADVHGGANTYRLEINSSGFEHIPADIAEKLGIKPIGGDSE